MLATKTISTPKLPAYTAATTSDADFIVDDGDYKVHIYTTAGNFAVTTVGDDATVDFLVIAGGSAGTISNGGGGGAGGYRTSYAGAGSEKSGGNTTAQTPITVTAQTYVIAVGAGGTYSSKPSAGSWPGGFTHPTCTVSSITSAGGSTVVTTVCGGKPGGYGAGGGTGATGRNGVVGGSGGGGGGGEPGNAPGGLGTTGEGFAGGVGLGYSGGYLGGGGGGGSGAIGTDALTSQAGGSGGAGTSSTITGSAVVRAGGGGGCGHVFATRAPGGSGNVAVQDQGGAGGNNYSLLGPAFDAVGASGDAPVSGNSYQAGSGGGGAYGHNMQSGTSTPGNGAQGIVILRYKFQ